MLAGNKQEPQIILIGAVLEPNDESAANVNAAKMWREDRVQFESIADALVRKTLGLKTTRN
jgi:ubiquitin-conjugating enzyme E2 G2